MLESQHLCDYLATKDPGARGWRAGRRKEKGKSRNSSCRCKLCCAPQESFSNRKYRKGEIRRYVMRKNKQSKEVGFIDALVSPLEMSRSEPINDQEVAGDVEGVWPQRTREPMGLSHFITAQLEATAKLSPAVLNPLVPSHSAASTSAPPSASWEYVDESFEVESIDDADLF